MKKIGILYETGEGHTETVADRIASVFKEAGCEVTTVRCKSSSLATLSASDGIVIGGSIHMGKNNAKLMRFVESNRELLAKKPNAFFLLCLTAKLDTPEKQAEVTGYLDAFQQHTGFVPKHAQAFAGALLYTKYNFVKRSIMKSITAKEGGNDLDTSRDYVYTDWEAVDRFARAFLASAN